MFSTSYLGLFVNGFKCHSLNLTQLNVEDREKKRQRKEERKYIQLSTLQCKLKGC